jgi:hypothetical protein
VDRNHALRQAGLRVPDPRFPTKTPAGRPYRFLLAASRNPAEGLTITGGPSWALCVSCVIGIPAEMLDPGSRTTAPRSLAGRRSSH